MEQPVFTLIVFFPAFLTIVFLLGCVVDRTLSNSRYRDTTLFFGMAMIGMLIEWFLIGLAAVERDGCSTV